MKEYCIRLRNLREDNDMTQEEIAAFLGTSQTMYSRYERGSNELPVRYLMKLCDLYRVSADYLLGRSGGKAERTGGQTEKTGGQTGTDNSGDK